MEYTDIDKCRARAGLGALVYQLFLSTGANEAICNMWAQAVSLSLSGEIFTHTTHPNSHHVVTQR